MKILASCIAELNLLNFRTLLFLCTFSIALITYNRPEDINGSKLVNCDHNTPFSKHTSGNKNTLLLTPFSGVFFHAFSSDRVLLLVLDPDSTF